jgi:preprotein translocase SecF subunit
MLYKGYDFFPHDKKWNILGWRNLFVGLSVAMMLLSVGLLVFRGLNYGVDFKGGTLFEVQAKSGSVDIAALRTRLNGLGLGDVQVQSAGIKGDEALVRIGLQSNEKAQAEAASKVRAALGEGLTVRRSETVGPTVSSELFWTGSIAVLLSLLGIMVYVWFRFEWQFAVAGIAALFHDVLITVGIFSLKWDEFDLATVAALLTLAGYSINDTVVTFDRVRENMRKYKRMPMEELLNNSVNETLSRTIMTAGSTFLAVLALWLFGTEAIQGFAFAMLFGVVIGTYSSVFVAAPIVLWLGLDREAFGGKDKTGPAVSANAKSKA